MRIPLRSMYDGAITLAAAMVGSPEDDTDAIATTAADMALQIAQQLEGYADAEAAATTPGSRAQPVPLGQLVDHITREILTQLRQSPPTSETPQ